MQRGSLLVFVSAGFLVAAAIGSTHRIGAAQAPPASAAPPANAVPPASATPPANATPPAKAAPKICPNPPNWKPANRDLHADADLCSANLSGAYLSGMDLHGADLTGAHLARAHAGRADLSGAMLDGADFTDADLSGANLSGATLSGANLHGAHLNHADLELADLDHSDLSGAHASSEHLIDRTNLSHTSLAYANLSDADLFYADLTGADLDGANLARARLAYSELTDAVYEPASDAPAPYVAGILGLDALRAAPFDESGVAQLRKLLEDAGLRDDERKVTYSLERSITRDRFLAPWWTFSWVEGVGRFVGFDLTTAYGLHPAYALGWIVLLGALLTPVYVFALLRPTAASGIVQVFPADRLDGTAGDAAEEKECKKTLVRYDDWRHAFPSAAYFSLMSSVNIGFEQFDPGDWLRRLQPRAYSFEAVGWVRVVAGAQALFSVYLLAMWALTQFGRPFE